MARTSPQPSGSKSGLAVWWRAMADSEAEGAAAKVAEYGSFDLDLLGWVMGHVQSNVATRSVPPVELGLAFYLLGKVARMWGAYLQGSVPSEDTLNDIVVYTRMVQRVRATGGWPG